MEKIFSKVFSVALGIILAGGWHWTNLLRTQEKLSKDQQLYISIILTLLFVSQQIYLVLPKPVPKAVVLGRRRVVENFLSQLMTEYYELISDSNAETGTLAPVVRINVMLPTLSKRGLLGKYVRIYYMRCPDGISYSGQEQELKWRKGHGLCGHTWETEIATSYDAASSQDSSFFEVAKTNKKAVEHINSALSLPIWCKHELVGLLNIDSIATMQQTKLNNQSVRDLFENYTDRLGDLCFAEGVAG